MKLKSLALIFLAAASLGMAGKALAEDTPALMPPVKSVYDNYLKIQAVLAQDSLKGVEERAGAIAKTVRGDTMKMLPSNVADQADKLAKARDLAPAREAFKLLSNSLVKYLADHKAPKGAYYKVYCPMADATWLQADKKIQNPYLGKAMPDCGEIKE
jgi:Cu(I)/Ag(I) efflux system membrane fusion protein